MKKEVNGKIFLVIRRWKHLSRCLSNTIYLTSRRLWSSYDVNVIRYSRVQTRGCQWQGALWHRVIILSHQFQGYYFIVKLVASAFKPRLTDISDTCTQWDKTTEHGVEAIWMVTFDVQWRTSYDFQGTFPNYLVKIWIKSPDVKANQKKW